MNELKLAKNVCSIFGVQKISKSCHINEWEKKADDIDFALIKIHYPESGTESLEWDFFLLACGKCEKLSTKFHSHSSVCCAVGDEINGGMRVEECCWLNDVDKHFILFFMPVRQKLFSVYTGLDGKMCMMTRLIPHITMEGKSWHFKSP